MADTSAPRLTATQLNAIIDRQSPGIAKLARSVLATMRARLPGAVEMVYDKKNALVIGFCSTERASNSSTRPGSRMMS